MQIPGNETVEPFGEVNIYLQADKSLRVVATILMTPNIENAQTGLAIDASRSMKANFGDTGFGGGAFGAKPVNSVELVGRKLAEFLANFDSDGNTTVIYWACGKAPREGQPGGGDIEERGDFSCEQAQSMLLPPPKVYGTGTQLLPAVKYFTETRFALAPWAIFVFITDGRIDDLEAVKAHTLSLAKKIAEGQRNFVKLVLIGVGPDVDEKQMEELDDLDYQEMTDVKGEGIDLWDHKIAKEMKRIDEIFAEVVGRDSIIAPRGEILDLTDKPVKSFSDGLPGYLDFQLPPGSVGFTLAMPDGQRFTQRWDKKLVT
jgi:hypothetical protein